MNKNSFPNTTNALKYYHIKEENIPIEVILTYIQYKKCAALANTYFKLYDKKIGNSIVSVCDDILKKKIYTDKVVVNLFESHTNLNMNINEIIAYAVYKKFKFNIDPIKHVNLSQSSNDSFSTVVHLISIKKAYELLSVLKKCTIILKSKIKEFKNKPKISKTHLRNAAKFSYDKEFRGFLELIEYSIKLLKENIKKLSNIPAGLTMIGTGENAPKNYSSVITEILTKETKLELNATKNKYSIISSFNVIQDFNQIMSILASNLNKISYDINLMVSDDESGKSLISIPRRSIGSSFMPQKNNPINCDQARMISLKVNSNSNEITVANSMGNFQLNIYIPLVANNTYQSAKLLMAGYSNFFEHCLKDVKLNK